MEYKDLASVEKENDILGQLWEIRQDWLNKLDAWHPIQFYDLNIGEMELEAIDVKSAIEKIEQSFKEVKQWPLTDSMKIELKNFLETLPVLDSNMGLSQKAIVERHWRDLRIELKAGNFDENSPEFNLEMILSLDLLSHREYIEELCEHAKKQMAIRVSIDQIKHSWEQDPMTELKLQKKPSTSDAQEIYVTVVSTEEIMALIEDHSNMLARHKSSPYYREFSEDIDMWETNIATMTENLEMLMQVQSMWQYLECIFMGQQDIQLLL